jgi:hypothetical protein
MEMYLLFMPLILFAVLQGGVQFNVGSPQLVPEVPKLAIPVPKPTKSVPKEPKQKAFVPFHIAAIGFAWVFNYTTGQYIISYIDPASDLAGKVQPGDFLLSTADEDPIYCTEHLDNFGDVNTTVNVIIVHNGIKKAIKCRRKPIEAFGPKFTKALSAYLRP